MTVRPNSQRKAMITIQRGPRENDNEASVTVDASSIETATPLSEAQTPEEERRENKKRAQIVGMMGLDTIASSVGFDNFFNYFTLRSIESELTQEILETQLENFDLSDREDKRVLAMVAGQQRVHRIYGNMIFGYHEALRNITKGVDPSESNSGFRSYFRSGEGGSPRMSLYSFYPSEEERAGSSDLDFPEAVEKYLGIEDFYNERPTIQYLKLYSDYYASFFPRTGPNYFRYDNRATRFVGMGDRLSGYINERANQSAEGFKDRHNIVEMTIHDAAMVPTIKCNTKGDPLRTSEGAPFKKIRGSHSTPKMLAAMIHVISRDAEVSSFVLDTEKKSRLQVSRITNSVRLRTVIKDLEEANNHIAASVVVPRREYPMRDSNGNFRQKFARILSYERVGNERIARGRRNSPMTISTGQAYELVQGGSNSSMLLEDINEDRRERAINSMAALVDTGFKNVSSGLTSQIGNFLKTLDLYVSRMVRGLERINPKSFDEYLADGGDGGGEGFTFMDETRAKAAGISKADYLATLNPEGSPAADRGAWRNAKHRTESLLSRAGGGIGGAGISSVEDEDKERLRELLNDFLREITDLPAPGKYNAASSGVIHIDSEVTTKGSNWKRQIGHQRVAMGLALVLGAMKKRNTKGSNNKPEYYHRLYSRFKFGVFTKLTQDYEGLLSSDPNLAYVDHNLSSGASRDQGVETSLSRGGNAEGSPFVLGGVDMAFRRPYVPRGGLGKIPFRAYGNRLSADASRKINHISAEGLDLDKKGEFFGYIKMPNKYGGKIRIPTSENSRVFYGKLGGYTGNGNMLIDASASDIADLVNRWYSNDIISICERSRRHGDLEEYSGANGSENFGVTLAGGQAEEYYEIGWALIGDIVANRIVGLDDEYKRKDVMTAEGLTKVGGVGLDSILSIFFELLGMVADAIPVHVCFATDFVGNSSDSNDTVHIEDVDLRNAVNEKIGSEFFPDYDQATRGSLFLSKSGVDLNESESSESIGDVESFNELYRELRRAITHEDALVRMTSGLMQNDGSFAGQRAIVNAAQDAIGESSTNKKASTWVNRMIEDLEDRLDSVASGPDDTRNLDVAIVVNKKLTFTMKGRRARSFEGCKTLGWIGSIAKYFQDGVPFRSAIKKYVNDHPDSKGGNVLFEGYSPDGNIELGQGERLDMAIDYYQTCDSYLDSLGTLRKGSIQDIFSLASHLYEAEAAQMIAYRGMMAFNHCLMRDTSATNSMIKKYTGAAHESDMMASVAFMAGGQFGEKHLKEAYENFDYTSKDRPTRTAAKLSPKGFATQNLSMDLRTLTPDDYNPSELLQMSCTSEYSDKIRRIVQIYFNSPKYKVDDTRESIVVLGCPSGTDQSILSSSAKKPLKVNGRFGRSDFNVNAFDNSNSSGAILRHFRLTVDRDFTVGPDEENAFSVERKYLHKYFLLPESFDEVDLDDAAGNSRGFVRGLAENARWYYCKKKAVGNGIDIGAPLAYKSFTSITRESGSGTRSERKRALEDMTESFILQWMFAMSTGVYIDQDLLFENERNINSMDLLMPGTNATSLSYFTRKETAKVDGGGYPTLGFDPNVTENLFVESPIPDDRPIIENINHTIFGTIFGTPRMGLVTDAEARNLVVDNYRTELDPDTGAEVIVPIVADIKPWNIRLTSGLMNTFMHRGPLNTKTMIRRPMFDYLMFIRVKKDDIDRMGIKKVDVVSYRGTITRGSSTDYLSAIED